MLHLDEQGLGGCSPWKEEISFPYIYPKSFLLGRSAAHFLSLWALQRKKASLEPRASGKQSDRNPTRPRCAPPAEPPAAGGPEALAAGDRSWGRVRLSAAGTRQHLGTYDAHRDCCLNMLPGLLQPTAAARREAGRASHELTPLAAGGARWVQLSRSANTSSHDDLICSPGRLPNPLPRWSLRAGMGAGGC